MSVISFLFAGTCPLVDGLTEGESAKEGAGVELAVHGTQVFVVVEGDTSADGQRVLVDVDRDVFIASASRSTARRTLRLRWLLFG